MGRVGVMGVIGPMGLMRLMGLIRPIGLIGLMGLMGLIGLTEPVPSSLIALLFQPEMPPQRCPKLTVQVVAACG